MREIKFRAWDDREEKMIFGEKVSIFNEEDNGFHSGRLVVDGDWLEMPLMQYIGLKDKNGKEIYEGDVINNVEAAQEPWMQVVEYSKDASFIRRDISDGDDDIWEFYGWDEVGQDFEIIGNIYESPELLEK